MSYIDKYYKEHRFRLLDQMQPHWKRIARLLNFHNAVVFEAEKQSSPIDYILNRWLEGANLEQDWRPISWDTLITALDEANMGEEVEILATYIIAPPSAPMTSSK